MFAKPFVKISTILVYQDKEGIPPKKLIVLIKKRGKLMKNLQIIRHLCEKDILMRDGTMFNGGVYE